MLKYFGAHLDLTVLATFNIIFFVTAIKIHKSTMQKRL